MLGTWSTVNAKYNIIWLQQLNWPVVSTFFLSPSAGIHIWFFRVSFSCLVTRVPSSAYYPMALPQTSTSCSHRHFGQQGFLVRKYILYLEWGDWTRNVTGYIYSKWKFKLTCCNPMDIFLQVRPMTLIFVTQTDDTYFWLCVHRLGLWVILCITGSARTSISIFRMVYSLECGCRFVSLHHISIYFKLSAYDLS